MAGRLRPGVKRLRRRKLITKVPKGTAKKVFGLKRKKRR